MAKTTTTNFNHVLFAGLFLGATTQVTGPTNALWHTLSLFSIVGPLPVLWLSLRDEFTSAIQACAIAFIYVLLSIFLLDVPYNVVTFIPEVLMILTIARYALLSRKTKIEEWYPVGRILTYLIGIAIMTIAVMIALEIGTTFPEETLHELAKHMANSAGDQENMLEALKLLLYFYPSILLTATLVIVLANTAFAQRMLEKKQQNIRPPGAFIQVSLPSYYLWFTAGIGLLTLLGKSAIGANALVLLFFGFFLVGLALVHELIRIYKLGTISLVVFYIIMILFGGIAILVCWAGVMEPWLRTRLKVLKK